MKIRGDFVTNSSSTSFIISMKGDFTKGNFLKFLNIGQAPWLEDVMARLFQVIDRRRTEVRSLPDDPDDLDFILSGFPHTSYEPARRLLAEKRKVYLGRFDDSGRGAEAVEHFFCRISILVSNEDLYFDALQDMY